MALKVISSIDRDDRNTARVLARSRDEAIAELDACVDAFTRCLETLAKAYPGTVAVGSISGGKALGALVFAPSVEGDFFSPAAMNRMVTLADIIAHLPTELVAGFEIELNGIRKIRELEAEKEKAVANALQAAAEKRSE